MKTTKFIALAILLIMVGASLAAQAQDHPKSTEHPKGSEHPASAEHPKGAGDIFAVATDAGESMQLELGLAAYNAGPHNTRRWMEHIPHVDPDAFVERIPYQETRKYVKLVLKNYTIYKALADV